MALNDLPEIAVAAAEAFCKTVDQCVIQKLDLGALNLANLGVTQTGNDAPAVATSGNAMDKSTVRGH